MKKSNSIKVLYLHQYFNTLSMPGGTRSFEMARRLVRSKHTVNVLTSKRDYNKGNHRLLSVSKEEGISVYWILNKYSNKMSFYKRIVAFLKFAILSTFFGLKIQCDVVFATSTPLTIAIPALIISKVKRIPLVFEVRDLWPEIPIAIGDLKNPLMIYFARLLEKTTYRNSESVIALSPGMKKGIMKTGYPSHKIYVIPNSSDVKLFRSDINNDNLLCKKYDWLGNNSLVLYAGTFGRINGVSYLVRIAYEMLRIDKNIIFLTVGEGLEKNDIEKLSKNLGILDVNFFILPSVNKKDMPILFSSATVCTSLFINLKPMWNNSANKFFDALAAGKPLMINYGSWQADILEESGAGIVVPPDNPKMASRMLHDFISDNSRLAAASKAAQYLAKNKFDRDILYKQFKNVLVASVGK